MTQEQTFASIEKLTEAVGKLTRDITEIKGQLLTKEEIIKNLRSQISENSEVVKTIHKLALSIELHSQKVEHLAEKMETRINLLEERQGKQGERIGVLEQKPYKKVAERWDGIVKQVVGLIIAAGFGWLIAWLSNR